MSISPGKYKAVAGAHGWSKTKNGKQEYSVELRVTAVIKGDENTVGESLLWRGSVEGGAYSVTAESLKQLGWDGENNPADCEFSKTADIEIKEEEYNGSTQFKVQILTGFSPSGYIQSYGMSAQDAKVASADFLAKVRAGKSSKPATKNSSNGAKPPPGASLPTSEDEIPF